VDVLSLQTFVYIVGIGERPRYKYIHVLIKYRLRFWFSLKQFFRDGINTNKNIPSESSVTSGETKIYKTQRNK
jgi:hypothetical protein